MVPAILLILAGVAALTDWWSVGFEHVRVEYVAKPAVLVLLIAAALALTPTQPEIRVAFVVGLVFGLAGDVLLMLDRFIPGAAAFLLGHVAYIVGLLMADLHPAWLAVGAVLYVALLATVGLRVVRAARGRSSTLGWIVIVYMLALGGVLVLGMGTGVVEAMLGVALFAVSDALLSYDRFVGPTPGGRVLVHMTYHFAQALLVVSLVWLH